MSKQLSGAQKRRKKAEQNAQSKALKGAMEKYVQITSHGDPEEIQEIAVMDNNSERNDDSEGHNSLLPQTTENEVPLVERDVESSSNDGILISKTTENKDRDELYLSAAKDIGFWPDQINDEFREYFIRNKPIQNIKQIHASKCVIGKKSRSLNESNFYRRKKNNELVKREWLVYSPVKNAVFCYICKLFSVNNQALCQGGFSYWKNTTERLQEHENSATHRNSVLCFSQRLSTLSRIDSKLVEEYEANCLYWRNVLRRVVSCIKFLSERGLAFYGNDETLHSVHNGNFRGLLELLSQYDPFIADHLTKYGNPGTGNVNYLSSTVVSEVIEIMGQKVLDAIVAEVKKSKYFGLIVDSTPDITHNDQLAVILRHVNDFGEPVERFIKFVHIHSHHSDHLTQNVLSLLEELNVDIKFCRGQSYDNASNMSGKYSGLQSQIKKLSPLAEYIPCSSHSLNLVGHNSAECCEKAASFFGLVQNLYVFFSSSTHRWEILSSKLSGGLTLKPVCSTRWSAAADATKCLKKNYHQILYALHTLEENDDEKASVKHEAKALRKKLEKFETAILLVVWDTILQRLNISNKTTQSTTCNISVLKPLHDSLIDFVQSVRDNFEQYEEEASKLAKKEYELKRKIRKPKNKFLDDCQNDNSVVLTGRDSFKTQCFYVICDALLSELHKRRAAYLEIQNRFGFLMKNYSEQSLKEDAKRFHSLYNSDIDDDFEEEMYQFFHFSPQKLSAEERLKIIRSQNIAHTFPNVDTALQILLTLPVSNCASERSFSVLKRIKNRLRSSITQENLAALSILHIESSLTSQLDFNDVIDAFACKKSRKKSLIIK